jgi:hypothetical protein
MLHSIEYKGKYTGVYKYTNGARYTIKIQEKIRLLAQKYSQIVIYTPNKTLVTHQKQTNTKSITINFTIALLQKSINKIICNFLHHQLK